LLEHARPCFGIGAADRARALEASAVIFAQLGCDPRAEQARSLSERV
jgi:hypothetical protein